jgi:Lon protease-like protein
MFPLSTVLFPHTALPLHVFEPRYRAMVADCLAGDRRFGVVLISHGSEVGGGDTRVEVGTTACVDIARRLPDGRWWLLASGNRRLRVTQWLSEEPYPMAVVEDLDHQIPTYDDALLRVAHAEVWRARALLSELDRSPALSSDASLGDEPDVVAWRLCALAPLGALDRQRVLETDDAARRLELLITLTKEVAADVSRLLAGG